MTSLFDVGKSAIQAYRQSLAVTGQNIANMNTEGYMRREADLQEVTASQGGITSLANQAGLGVRIADIRRSFDAFLLDRARSSTSGFERMDNYLNQIMQLENMLLPSDADLGSQIGRFFNALSEVASSPGDLAPRVVAIEEGDALASRFNSLSGQLSQQESGTLSMLDDAVAGVSLLAKELASINSRILSSGQSGQSPNSLLDLRDRIIGDIAKLTDVSVKYDDRGYADITLGSSGVGPSLVSMSTSTSVGYVLREDTIQIVLNPGLSNTPTSQVSSGMIAGLVDAFSMTKEVAKEVNHLANLVSTDVNKQHKLGVDLDGKTGAQMFSTSGLEIAVNPSNSSSLVIEITVNDVDSLPQKPMTAVFNAAANQWTLTGDNLEGPLRSKERINGPGFDLAITGDAKDGDSFYVNPQKNAAAGLTFLLKRPQEIAAASATSVSADNKNTGEASLIIKAGQTAETFVEKDIANTLANSQAPVEATNFLRDGLVATVPAGTSNIELSSFAKQAAASFQISATDIGNLTQFRFELDGSDNDGPHSFNITHAAAYPNAPSGQKWSEMSEISALLNNGVLRSSGGFSLADLGLHASGGAGSFVIASAKGNFKKTGSEVAHVVTQSGTISASLSDAVDASNVQVFTREGRHLAGSALTTMQIDDLVKTQNGFSVEAVYRGDYLNKNENGYRGANINILSEGGHFVVATGSNGMAAAAIGGTDIVPSNALVDRNLTITMANGETRQTSISAGAWASDVANKINTDLADIGVRATAQLRVELSAFQTTGQVQFDITSLNEEPITISASVTPTTLDSLALAINRESDNTGVSAVVSTNGKRIILESKGGADIVLNNVIEGAPLFSSKVLKSDGSAATTSAGTARVVTLADHGTPAFEAAMNANAAAGDKYVIDVAGTDIEYTLIGSDVTSLQAAADTAARVRYLAGKLDIDANTAASGSDIGYGVTSSGTSFIVTKNAVGADSTVIGPIRLDPNGGGAEADLGAAVSSVDGRPAALVIGGTVDGNRINTARYSGIVTISSSDDFTFDAGAGLMNAARDNLQNALVTITGNASDDSKRIVFNVNQDVDRSDADLDGLAAVAASAVYSLSLPTSDTAISFLTNIKGSAVTPLTLASLNEAMISEVRAQAPIASFSGNAIPANLPADGETVTMQYAGDLYNLTMSNGEVVVSGGEPGRVTAYFDAAGLLQIFGGGTLAGESFVLAGDNIVSDNSNMALKFGIAAGKTRLTGQEITLSGSLPTLNINFNGTSVAVDVAADGTITQTPAAAGLTLSFQTTTTGKGRLVAEFESATNVLALEKPSNALGFKSADLRIKNVDGAIQINSISGDLVTVDATATSLAKQTVKISNMAYEDLIVLVSGAGARSVGAAYDEQVRTNASEPLTIRVTDASSSQIEILDSISGHSIATRQLDANGFTNFTNYEFELRGDAGLNDQFTIAASVNAAGDNQNLNSILELRTLDANGAGSGGFQKVFNTIVAGVGASVQSGGISLQAAEANRDAAAEAETQFSGVNLDAEAAALMEFQQAYQASARILSTARELFQALIDVV